MNNDDKIAEAMKKINEALDKAYNDYFEDLYKRIEQDWAEDFIVRGSGLIRFDTDFIDSLRYSLAYSPIDQNTTTETTCNHEMKKYVGLTNSFHYCTKCDHKEFT